jgi:phosphopantothenate synthetase
MNELSKPNGSTQITALDEVINAHQFLKDFIAKFDHAKRGGIHDFMEIALFNMINSSIKEIDKYLQTGHHEVNATEIMHIVVDSYQKVLDGIKRNLGEMRPVNFK